MPQLISAKIDVKKIDKSRLFRAQSGALYLDVILIPSKNDRYGNDYMVTQSVSKEEREAGAKGAILGNAKIIGGKRRDDGDAPERHSPPPRSGAKPAGNENLDEDVPF